MTVHIVAAAENDSCVISALESACFSDSASEDMIRSYLASGNSAYFLAFTDAGVPVGYCGMMTAADEADILNVAVLPGYRRQGIARSLMNRMLDTARLKGVRTIYLEVRESGIPARELYRSLGFTVIGLRKLYYSNPCENAVLMSLGINDMPARCN